MDPFAQYLPELEAEMRWAVTPSPKAPDLLYGMVHYHLGWVDQDFQTVEVSSGKRIRPMLLLLSCEAQGGNWRQALPAAAAIELLHNFTLIHDDIEDRDKMRRGRATLWTLWGDAQAINAGDALFTLAYKALQSIDDVSLPAERILQALNCYTNGILKITEGQCWDIGFETQSDISEDQYLHMIRGKTATLLGVACELGSIIAGSGPSTRQALREFGEALGMAFQMQDDLLGLWGDTERTGKPVGADIRRRKKTLPILHGIAHSPQFAAMMAQPVLDETQIHQALNILQATGSKTYTEAQAQHYHNKALNALKDSEGKGAAQQALHDLAQKLLGREK